MQDLKLLDKTQYEQVFSLTRDIIENMPEDALSQLTSGTEKDLDRLLNTIVQTTYETTFAPAVKLNNYSYGYLDRLIDGVDEILKRESLSYFTSNMMPDFEMNFHHVEWGSFASLYKYLSIIAARDHCLGKGTEVRMYDGSLKKVEDIRVGELVMGVDSTPRKVLKTHRGKDRMFKIHQKRAMSFVVSAKHDLYLHRLKKKIKISAEDLYSKSKYWQSISFGVRTGFELPYKPVKIEPYFLGLWLGDGCKYHTGITNIDKEVIDYIYEYADRLNMRVSTSAYRVYKISRNKAIRDKNGKLIYQDEKRNLLEKLLIEYNLLHNKHIPEDYFNNSREVRMQLLAGFIDSDGTLGAGCYVIGQKKESLIDDIIRLCDSLGFRAIKRYHNTHVKYLGRKYESWSVCITGADCHLIPTKIKRKQKKINLHTKNMQHSRIDKIEDLGIGNYYGFELDGDHKFLLRDGTITYNSKSFFWSKAYPIWQMYRYEKPSLIKRVHPKFSILKQGMIITAEKSLATFLLSLIKDEIENNPLLREALYPGLSEGWSATGIVCKNGAGMTAKSYGTKKRGFHPGWIVVDDFQTDQVMYSKEQREKYIDHFMSVIMNMIVPNGQVINVGTPYHQQDLFSVLKKSKAWKVFEYPAILPDGRVLWSNRYTLEHILEKRYSQGNLVFSREFLCRPISSESTIFPWSILQRSFMGMDKYTLVDNIHSHPLAKQFSMVVVGCDFAISSNVGADSSVFSVWGVDERDRYWLLYCWIGKGVKYGEQIARLKWINTNFRPTVFGMESNQMQMIFAQESDAQGLPVKACNTGTNKHDLIKGLPGLAILFEQGRILMPRGDQRSRDISDEACLQFSNIAFTDKGLESVGEHDDFPMSFWTGLKIAQEAGVGFNFSWM